MPQTDRLRRWRDSGVGLGKPLGLINIMHPIEKIRDDLNKSGCFHYDNNMTYCFPWGGHKLSALLFDRLYFDSYDYIQWNDQWDIYEENGETSPVKRIPSEVVYLSDKLSSSMTDAYEHNWRGHPTASDEKVLDFYKYQLPIEARNEGLLITPLFDNYRFFKSINEGGETEAWNIIYDSLPSIDDQSTSWKQILEFRKDKDNLIYYRNIRKLHRKLLAVNSEQEAIDILGEAEEKYQVALNSHGFKLLDSCLTIVCEKEAIISAGIGGAISGSIPIAVAAGGLMVASKLCLKFAESKIEKKKLLLSEDGEAALISEIGKQFRK